MMASIETKLPYLDHELIKAAWKNDVSIYLKSSDKIPTERINERIYPTACIRCKEIVSETRKRCLSSIQAIQR